MAKTVVALYDDAWDAYEVVRGVLALGIKRDDVGLVFHDHDGHDARGARDRAHVEHDRAEARARLRAQRDAGNAVVGGMAGAFVGLGLATVPVIGPILAIGPLALGAIGAGIGVRYESWVEALGAFGIPPDDVGIYAEGVRRGGVVVTVRTHDDWVRRVVEILARGRPVDVAARSEAWRREGWRGFDGSAPPMTAEEIERERASRAPPAIPSARASLPPDRASRPSLPM